MDNIINLILIKKNHWKRVVKKMKPPCEIVVWYLIPGIRSVLAKELFSLGMKQKEISAVLDITQPAVSQYLSDKRGNEVGFCDEILEMIKKFSL